MGRGEKAKLSPFPSHHSPLALYARSHHPSLALLACSRVPQSPRSLGKACGGGSPLLIFRPNWGPKGRKKLFWILPPPPPTLSQDLDPALKTKSFADPTNTASLHTQTVGVVSSRKKFVE